MNVTAVKLIESPDFESKLVGYELILTGRVSNDDFGKLILLLSKKMHTADFNGTKEYMKIFEVRQSLIKQK